MTSTRIVRRRRAWVLMTLMCLSSACHDSPTGLHDVHGPSAGRSEYTEYEFTPSYVLQVDGDHWGVCWTLMGPHGNGGLDCGSISYSPPFFADAVGIEAYGDPFEEANVEITVASTDDLVELSCSPSPGNSAQPVSCHLAARDSSSGTPKIENLAVQAFENGSYVGYAYDDPHVTYGVSWQYTPAHGGTTTFLGYFNVQELDQTSLETTIPVNWTPPTFATLCNNGVSANVTVERSSSVLCLMKTPDTTVSYVSPDPFIFFPDAGAGLPYKIGNVTETTDSWQGFVLQQGTVRAQVRYRRGTLDSGTVTSATALITVTPRLGFPAVTSSSVIEPTDSAGYSNIVDVNLGFVQAVVKTASAISEVGPVNTGPNTGYVSFGALPYSVQFRVRINDGRLADLVNIADASPTDGSCSKTQVQTLKPVVQSHEAVHLQLGKDYINNRLSSIRTNAEALVTSLPYNHQQNQEYIFGLNALDAAMLVSHQNSPDNAVTYMMNTFGCTLRL